MMQVTESAESFAREKYANSARKDGTLHMDHLRGVVTRLKSLGVSDSEILAAAWLYEMIDDAKSSFDEIDKRFGSRISVLVLALSKDSSLTRDQIEKQYVKQIRESTLEAKLIKFCDISTSFKNLKNSSLSKTRRTKHIKKEMYYLSTMKTELARGKSQYPGIQSFADGINDIASSHGQRPVTL